MRKAAILGAVILPMLTIGAQPAGAYCIEMPDFCDQVQVDTVSGFVFGRWDWTCDGVTLVPVAGSVGVGVGSFAADPLNDGTLVTWTVNIGASTSDLWMTDGFAPVQLDADQPITITPGVCNFGLAGGGTSYLESLSAQ